MFSSSAFSSREHSRPADRGAAPALEFGVGLTTHTVKSSTLWNFYKGK